MASLLGHDYSNELSIIKLWVPVVSSNDSTSLIHHSLLDTEHTKFGEQFIVEYLRLIWPYLDVLGYKTKTYREADAPASGVVFFYGCLMYIVHFPNWGDYLPDIIYYNLMYQLVDHYLDDNTISDSQRNIDLQTMLRMLDFPTGDYSHCTNELQALARAYQQLLERRPQCKDAVKSLFIIELQSMTKQKNGKLQRSEYYQLALTKGRLTMQVLGSIMNISTIQEQAVVDGIGHIMQLVDDCMDVLADQEKGIHTTATYDLIHDGNLDRLWSDIVIRIGQLPNTINVFKIVYCIFAVYLPDRVNVFSPNLQASTHQYNWCRFDGSGLLTGAVDRIIDELLSGHRSFNNDNSELSSTVQHSLAYLINLYDNYIKEQQPGHIAGQVVISESVPNSNILT